MSNSILTRRSVLQIGAVAGAGLALPTILTAGSHSGYTNAPTGGTVTLGFNVPQTGAYADEGADELRAYELAVEHLNGGGDGGMVLDLAHPRLDRIKPLPITLEVRIGLREHYFLRNIANEDALAKLLPNEEKNAATCFQGWGLGADGREQLLSGIKKP